MRYEYRMVEVNDRYGLPGGCYSQMAEDGWRAIKIYRSRREPNDRGFIVVYERPVNSSDGQVGETK